MINSMRFRLGILTLVTIGLYASKENPLSTTNLEKMYRFSPRKLEPIVHLLARSDFLISIRGMSGGYFLNTEKSFNLGQIARCLDVPSSSKKKEMIVPLVEAFLEPITNKAKENFFLELEMISLESIIEKSKEKAHSLFPDSGSDYTI